MSGMQGAEGASSASTAAFVCMLAAAAGVATLLMFLLTPEQRAVAVPTTIAIGAVAGMFFVLWRRDRKVPLFDIGIVCAGVTLIYVVLPPIFFLLAGLQWSDLSDGRLYYMNPSPEEFGTFLWMSVAYLAGFAFTYSLIRGIGAAGPEMPVNLPKDQAWTIVLIAIGAIIYRILIERIYEVDLAPSYRELNPGIGYGYDQLPLVLQQITHNVLAIGQIAKLALVLYLLSNWQAPWARRALIGWLLIETYMTATHQGARTATALLLLAAILAYHRLVKPFTLPRLAILLSVFLGALLAYGFVRSFSSTSGQMSAWEFFSAANEFQVLAGTAMHVAWLDARGGLGHIPWQVYFSDLTALVPQQLLPFEKLDPGYWYLDVSGLGLDVGLMFGVSAQGVIGYGVPEMLLRGIGLALVLGLIHRIYLRRASSFWRTLCYLFLAVHIYYSYRATSFYWVYYFVYRFLPFFLVVQLVSVMLRQPSGLHAASSAAPPAK